MICFPLNITVHIINSATAQNRPFNRSQRGSVTNAVDDEAVTMFQPTEQDTEALYIEFYFFIIQMFFIFAY